MNKILVVDNDLEILTVGELMLSMHNLTVSTISNWKDINKKMIDFQPDQFLFYKIYCSCNKSLSKLDFYKTDSLKYEYIRS